MGSSNGAEKGYLKSSHLNMLASAVRSLKVARQSLLYSYSHSINGFSAVLSEEQAQSIASMAGVVSVFPSRMHSLHTTRSWDFLGLDADYVGGSLESRLNAPATSDVIIGLLDTGVWPESESFNDEGMGPIPDKWKGKCDLADDFNSSNCNRKLIGARFYGDGSSVSTYHEANLPIYKGPSNDMNQFSRPTASYGSARDSQGHGTHTATTAGGRAVTNASYYGLAKGVARGGAPLSRIAAYKVCSEEGCSDADILAAFDDAIKDGVDILSLSLGGPSFLTPNLLTDGIAIGAFHAVQNGILVVCSAGNDGPYSYTAVNTAPWILTVAASTVDRFFDSKVVLGDNKTYEGQALNYFKLNESSYPIVFGGDIAAPNISTGSAGRCISDSLDATKAKGKIVLCVQNEVDQSRQSKSYSVQSAGGVGMIIADDNNKFFPSIYAFPATQVSKDDGKKIHAYIRSTNIASATILPAETLVKFKPAPVVAKFSARGPSKLTENILKPDIAAPGVNILAGWTMSSPYSDPPLGENPSPYAIISGTSMSCPHVSGAAAFVKSVNSNWSASAIKSALMTTATTTNNANTHITNDTGYAATEFDLGTGELNPMNALDPGLVYESDPNDHFLFLCYFGYNQTQIGTISGNKSFVCPAESSTDLISNLNYPSIAIAKLNGTRSLVRTLTNVGPPNSTYKTTVVSPQGVSVTVSPEELVFSTNKKSITVNIELKVTQTPSASIVKNYVFGSLSFSDDTHTVTTPIIVNPVSM
ncbi:CO(2)-response secreted protease isoform X2 [Cryptomeria japonica]|nr:CO(2)-response secreted protease isoform X2 [Cryptomeria japonica]